MNSRGAATECNPGRKPGVFFRDVLSPVGAKESFAPTGLVYQNDTYPGLSPGATLCRRSAAEYRRGFQRKLTRKGFLTLITFFRSLICSSLAPGVFLCHRILLSSLYGADCVLGSDEDGVAGSHQR